MSISLNDQNFDKELQNTNKFALVDFFATWCEPCNALAPILEKVAEDLKDKVVLMKANTDDVPMYAGKFGVESIPMVVLFKDGKAISGFVGLRSEIFIKEWLEEMFKKNETPVQDTEKSEKIEELAKQYEEYAKNSGFNLNPDKKAVERVINGLLQNEKKYGEKYCPCRRVVGNKEEDAKKICPCFWHKDEIEKDGHCFCNLYVK